MEGVGEVEAIAGQGDGGRDAGAGRGGRIWLIGGVGCGGRDMVGIYDGEAGFIL